LSIAALPDFQRAIQLQKICQGGTITTVGQLEALRFCTIINGSIYLEINHVDADFTALQDLEEIQGLSIDFNLSHPYPHLMVLFLETFFFSPLFPRPVFFLPLFSSSTRSQWHTVP
jgi:hypothetical protein